MQISVKKMWTIVALVVVLMVVGAVVMTSFYHTTEDQYAVVTTFGKPSLVENSGLHFKLPLVQRKYIISKNIRGIPIGYADTGESIESESVMITRDYNFVDVDFYVEWKVTDPVKYLYASADPENILKMITQSYIRDTIGLYGVDSVITTGKSEIQAAIKSKIADRIARRSRTPSRPSRPPSRARRPPPTTPTSTRTRSSPAQRPPPTRWCRRPRPTSRPRSTRPTPRPSASMTCTPNTPATPRSPASACSLRPWATSCRIFA